VHVSGKEIAEKTCASCGRRIQWRAKWAKNWAEVRYCSDACRSRRVSAADLALEADILTRLEALPRGRTIPSSPDEPSRRAARRPGSLRAAASSCSSQAESSIPRRPRASFS